MDLNSTNQYVPTGTDGSHGTTTTGQWTILKDYPAKQPVQTAPCPSCGYCPHCGHRPWGAQPYIAPQPLSSQWPPYGIVWC